MKATSISRLGLVFLISLALVGPAEAQERNRKDRQESRLHMLDHVLDLTDEQKAQIEKIREEGKAQANAAREESKAAFEAVLTDSQKAELEEWESEHGNRFATRSRARRNARASRSGRSVRGGRSVRSARSVRSGRSVRSARSVRRGDRGMQNHRTRGRDRAAGLIGLVTRHLDLSDAQKDQFKTLRQGQLESNRAFLETIKEKSAEEKKEAIEAKRVEMEAKIAEILTDEQEAKLAEIKENGSEKRGRRGNRRSFRRASR